MKIRIALFLSFVFTSLLVVPTIITLADESQEIAFFLDTNDDDENNGKESTTDTEIKIEPTQNNSNFLLNYILKKKNVYSLSKKYMSEYSKNATPPPEFLEQSS